MRLVRPRLTYANIVSSICLFIVLGGAAYAATQLPRNSVGTRQLRTGAVTRKKINRATLKGLESAAPAGPQTASIPQTASTPPGGTLPAGTTLRGAFGTSMQAGSNTLDSGTGGTESFGGYRLATRPVANVIPNGAPTVACPGSPSKPEATAGNLCLYITSVVPATGQVTVVDPGDQDEIVSGVNFNLATMKATVFKDGTVSDVGFAYGYSFPSASDGARVTGTWAVTVG